MNNKKDLPTAGEANAQNTGPTDSLWLRPQTFFPHEQPTGLEGLFARMRVPDDVDGAECGRPASYWSGVR
jgi:hypothetical protein